jgi:cell division protein FtsB
MRGRIQSKNLRQQVVIERKRRNIIFFTIIILAFIYISSSMLFGDMGLIKYLGLNRTKSRLETEVKNIEKENKSLKSQTNALKKDPFYIEKYAREEYGLAKPDEYIFQFHDDKN